MIMRYHWGLAVGHIYARQHLPDTSLEHQNGSGLASDSGEEYEVQMIMASRLQRGKLQYLVHWKGYPHEEDTWEPEEHLLNSTNLVHKFHRDNPSSPCHPEETLSENESLRSSTSSNHSSGTEPEHFDDSDSSGMGALD
jgi:hypothetical protein